MVIKVYYCLYFVIVVADFWLSREATVSYWFVAEVRGGYWKFRVSNLILSVSLFESFVLKILEDDVFRLAFWLVIGFLTAVFGRICLNVLVLFDDFNFLVRVMGDLSIDGEKMPEFATSLVLVYLMARSWFSSNCFALLKVDSLIYITFLSFCFDLCVLIWCV